MWVGHFLCVNRWGLFSVSFPANTLLNQNQSKQNPALPCARAQNPYRRSCLCNSMKWWKSAQRKHIHYTGIEFTNVTLSDQVCFGGIQQYFNFFPYWFSLNTHYRCDPTKKTWSALSPPFVSCHPLPPTLSFSLFPEARSQARMFMCN